MLMKSIYVSLCPQLNINQSKLITVQSTHLHACPQSVFLETSVGTYIYSPTWNVHEQCTFHVGLYIYTSGWQQPGPPPLPQLISYGPTFKAISHCFCIFLGTKCLASGFSDRRGLLICRCYCEALKAMLVGEVY